MATKTKARNVRKALRDVDDMLHILTGKRLKDIIGKTFDLYADDVAKNVAHVFTGPDELGLPESAPYLVLGIHPLASDIVVKAAFRALVKDCHPDTASCPDPKRFQEITEAYATIMAQRGASATKPQQ